MKRKDLPWIILLTIIALFPNIYLAIVGYDLDDSFVSKIAFLCVSIIIFFIPVLFLKAKVFFLFQSIFLLLAAPIEIAHIHLNKTGITTGFLMAVFDTNFYEATEMLSSIIPFIIVVFIFWFIYFFITIKKINNSYLIPNLKYRIYISVGIILIFSCLFLYYYQMSKKIVPENEQFRVMNKTWSTFNSKFYKIYPCNFMLRTKNVIASKNEMKRQQEKLKTFSFQAKKQEEIEEREIYVFVIGETARYSSFSINGYERKTSPLLEKINNLVWKGSS